jgi:polysaccharide deacetylase family protein (PEP-CTERM system associated)
MVSRVLQDIKSETMISWAGKAPVRPLHALTIDVEDYYHVSAFKSVVSYGDWGRYESRVEKNTRKLLEILAAENTKATFFILGWVAERHRDLVKSIQAEGHEVASHGYNHEMLTQMKPEQFREDIRRAKSVLENITGSPVLGYRAPSFTIMRDTIWALGILAEEGFVYDSSIFPILHDRYGMPSADPCCHSLPTPAGPIWEVPPSTTLFVGVRVPIAGGGYFRLFPYWMLRRLLHKVADEGHPLVMYFHPWEIDPQQPRIPGPLLTMLRHYVNLDKAERRFIQLIKDFRFGSICEVIEPIAQELRQNLSDE